MLKRSATSAVLSLLFIVVYGSCNWLTSLRTDVGVFYFEWERHMPFMPWAIVPYMSIDLFFIGAPFLCQTEDELRTLARRIAFVILTAGICFLLFPLRFAFERAVPSGWAGTIFGFLHGFDQPYNLLPSLHIALRAILAVVYARHSHGFWRLLSHIWFSLIGISTLLTYQHHVADIAGGFILAAYGFYLFREQLPAFPVLQNLRVGTFYALAAVLIALANLLLGVWGLFMLWPAVSMGIVAAGYFGIGPGILAKENGRLPVSTRFVLGPYLLGQYFSVLYYRTQCQRWDKVAAGVWIGRKLTDAEADEAIECGVTAVLDLTAEFDEARPFLNLRYRNIPILDLTSPNLEQMREMAEFMARESARGTVYVHCKIGYSRSAAAIGAYLLSTGEVGTVGQVVETLRRVRPSIVVRPEIIETLEQFRGLQQRKSFRSCVAKKCGFALPKTTTSLPSQRATL